MTTLVTGGAASGKSEYAEHLAETAHAAGRETPLLYIATMAAPDDESRDRVRKHRDRRAGKGYETVECPDGDALAAFAERLNADAEAVLLLDDFGNLVANELFAPKRVGEALAPMSISVFRYLPMFLGLSCILGNAINLIILINMF